jgi:hypothetical protein
MSSRLLHGTTPFLGGGDHSVGARAKSAAEGGGRVRSAKERSHPTDWVLRYYLPCRPWQVESDRPDDVVTSFGLDDATTGRIASECVVASAMS